MPMGARMTPCSVPQWLLKSAMLLWTFSLVADPAMVVANERVEARQYFQAGMSQIAAGQYLDGITNLEKAYKLVPHPAVLYNIGKAYLEAERYDEALDYFNRYLSSDPEDQDDVRVTIARVRLRRASAASVSSPDPAPEKIPTQAVAPIGSDVYELSRKIDQIAEQLDALLAANQIPSPKKGSPPKVALEPPDREAPRPAAPSSDPYAPVVVTASRFDQSPLDAPNAITILTSEDIRRSGCRTIPELFRRIPGIDIMAVSPGDYNLGIRGFNSTLANKVLVLVDGRSLYLDFVGATLWPMLSISLSDIERIEVIRGPGAALYGANAFSGVINIITRSPGAEDDRPGVYLSAGVPDHSVGSVHLTGRNGPIAFRASAGFERLDRFATEVTADRDDWQLMARYPEQAVHINRLDARLDRRISRETTLSVSGGLATGQAEFAAIGALRDFRVDGSYSYLRGDLALPHGFSLRTFWNHFDVVAGPWAVPVGGFDITSAPTTDVLDGEIEYHQQFHLGIDHQLNAGIGYRFKTIEWEWLGVSPREHHASFFVQDEAAFFSNLRGIVSVRFDRHPLLVALDHASWFDQYAMSPRAALVFRPVPNQAIRSTVGTAFRTPTFVESYMEQPIPTSTDAVVVRTDGNLNLTPERILSGEIGYLNQPSSGRFELEADLYANRISRLVQLSDVTSWTNASTVYDAEQGLWFAGTSNFSTQDEQYAAVGAESGLRLYPEPGIDLYTNYAIERIYQNPRSDRKVVRNTSTHKVNAGLQLQQFGILFGTDLSYISSQIWQLRSFDAQGNVVLTDVQIPGYLWVNARFGYRSGDKRFEATLVGSNLLAPFRAEVAPGDSVVQTPGGTHREYPLGQPIPIIVSFNVVYRFW